MAPEDGKEWQLSCNLDIQCSSEAHVELDDVVLARNLEDLINLIQKKPCRPTTEMLKECERINKEQVLQGCHSGICVSWWIAQ